MSDGKLLILQVLILVLDESDSDKHSTTAQLIRPSTMGGRISYREPTKPRSKSKISQKLTIEPEKSFMEIAHSCM